MRGAACTFSGQKWQHLLAKGDREKLEAKTATLKEWFQTYSANNYNARNEGWC
ncbi:hypothetical protein ACP4OV_028878 [Aristida adscensionis]